MKTIYKAKCLGFNQPAQLISLFSRIFLMFLFTFCPHFTTFFSEKAVCIFQFLDAFSCFLTLTFSLLR